jgi:hypothetical protein
LPVSSAEVKTIAEQINLREANPATLYKFLVLVCPVLYSQDLDFFSWRMSEASCYMIALVPVKIDHKS